MENNYLTEAFKKLNLLEDEFNFSADKDAVDELSYFVADDIDEIKEEPIIDMEAEDENELQDHYIGKVVIECQCCHSRLYKDPAEVIKDEDSGLMNINEVCPVCDSACGYTVIGEIKPFGEEEIKAGDDIEEEPLEEPVDAPEEKPAEDTDVQLEESVKSALRKITEDIDEVTVKTDEGQVKVDNNDSQVLVDFSSDDIPMEEDEEAETIAPLDNETREQIESNVAEDEMPEDGEEFPSDDIMLDDEIPEEAPIDNLDKEAVDEVPAEEESANEEESPVEEPAEEELPDEDSNREPANESLQEECNKELHEESLADKLQAKLDLLNSEDNLSEECNSEDKLSEECEVKEDLHDKLLKKLQSLDIEEELSIDDIEDIDDEAYDDLMESYLNRVYSNIASFKTKKIDIDDNKLIAEGVITFKSGNHRNTTFIFENVSRSKKGDIILEGTNNSFTNMQKAFKLRSSLKDGKLLPESMIYHYTNKKLNESADDSKFRIYGRVQVSKK